MRKLRAGVIGLGVGRSHVKGYQGHPRVEVVAICDENSLRLQAAGDELGIPGRYSSAAAMFKAAKLDLVSVATPNKFHKPLALAAFKAGCHVLCEKPLALSAAEGSAMIAAAKKAKKRLMVNFSYRFSEASQALWAEVSKGVLGKVYFGRTSWHRRRGIPGFGGWFGQKALSGGGPLIDLGVHRLDLALWLMGFPEPKWVLGSTYHSIGSRLAKQQGKAFDVEDLAVAMIQFKNGACLELEASWAANIKENELMETRLLGTQGGLVQRNLGGDYKFESELFLEKDGELKDLRPAPVSSPIPSSHYHFADCILKNKPHSATAEEGLKVMKILDAIYLSAKKGGPVKI